MIELQNVTFHYDSQPKKNLDDFSITIPKGQCILLCGESGSGKTTLTRLLNGLIPYFYDGKLQGEIEKDGIPIGEQTLLDLSKQIGSVFQNPRSQFFNTDTDSEIVFGLENMGFQREKIKNRYNQVVQDLNIEKLCNKSIFELSGGEKQKIAFASVYALNPEVYILDEPSSNLDYSTIKYLSKIIDKIKSMGKTIIISEHRIHYLIDVVDRVIYIKDGNLAIDVPVKKAKSIENDKWFDLGLRCRNLADVQFVSPNIKKTEEAYEITAHSCGYRGHAVLKDISVKVNGGEIIAITGENGAGKSTFAKAICGLIDTKKSTFSYNHKKLSTKERNKISYMVMQDVNHQIFSNTVMNECKLGIRGIDDCDIKRILKEVSLDDFIERHPLSLSGGQKQRLSVAISKLSDKKIIVFDEPTSGLDLKGMYQVSKLMSSLAEKGKIVFVITHDYELVMSSCTRVINLAQGKISFDTTDKEIFAKEIIKGG